MLLKELPLGQHCECVKDYSLEATAVNVRFAIVLSVG